MSNSIMRQDVLQGRWLTPITSRQFPESEEASELLNFDASDQGNAEAVVSLFGEKIRHTPEVGWLVWNGTHYEASEEHVWKMVEETLQKRREAAVKAERSEKNERLIKLCVGDAYRVEQVMKSLSMKVRTKITDFDNNPDLLNVKNGVLDLRTGKLSPHSPGQLFTYCAPVAYNPEAESSQWEQFLRENVAGGPEVLRHLQEALGYTLTGRVDAECLFFVYGEPRAGKGTLFEAMHAILGTPLAATVQYKMLAEKRGSDSQNFELAPLKPARLIVATETGAGERFNAGMIKEITGGGSIRAAHKYGTAFEYKVRFKIWVSSNHKANADASDTAFWTRVRVFEFPNARDEDTANPAVKRAMKSQESLEGLLKWMVEGAKRWYSYEAIWPVPTVMKAARDAHRKEADSVGQWIDECCKIDKGAFATNSSLRESYEKFCKEEGFIALGARRFNEYLSSIGLKTQHQKKIGLRNERGVLGIRLSQDNEPDEDDTPFDPFSPELD